jgi:hypothetical protein
MVKRRFLVSILVMAGAAIPASATLTTYTNSASFTAATGDQTFQNITFPMGAQGSTYVDLLTSTTFMSTTGLVGIGSPPTWPPSIDLQEPVCTGTNCTNTLTITLTAAVTSFSMYFGPQNFSSPTVRINNSGGDSYVYGGLIQPNINTPIFFGFVTDTPITSFTIQSAAPPDLMTFGGVEIGTSEAQTPEAGTLLLLGGALLMLRFARRWIPRRAPEAAAVPC